MKSNRSLHLFCLCISLAGLAVALLINRRTAKLRRERLTAVDSAHVQFARAMGKTPDQAFDSAFARGDTILYFKKKEFVGSSVTTTEVGW